jgi:lipopolysaccharide/colanic/teichoic acid biosynthesis glycosyltransferase
MKLFYKPAYFYLLIDLLILFFSLYIVLDWFPLTTHSPFDKYSTPSLFYMFFWVIFSYFLKRYRPLKKQQYFQISLRLFYVSLLNFVVFFSLIHFFFKPYSGFVLLSITLGAFIVNYLFISIYFAYRLAVDYNEINVKQKEDRINAVVKPAIPLDEESYKQLKSTIRAHSSENVLRFLDSNVDLTSGNTLVFVTTDVANLQMNPNYQYSSIIQLERLNNIRKINKKLSVINEKLPDNGIFVCCFESKSTRKKRILKCNPTVINYIYYFFDYLYKRVMPKIFITRGLYYLITRGNNRIFSKAEILGRLYCFGFKVITEKKVGQLTYVISQRIKQPELVQKRIYGPLIRLRRFGKNGKLIEVYKIRTMHPFSEYIQSYVYERHNLNEDGKFNKDIRITTIGRLMRKYWIDELPMILNLLNGEMKLVGVRPLSKQYFNLYCKELQEKRIKFKPGLLPPFYADMPKTLDEIQESEMNYLRECETKGSLTTDFKYLFRILKNILIKNARSG